MDTNVFVAAAFNRESGSARILRDVEEGRLRMPWTPATRGEIRTVIRQIPGLSWEALSRAFRDGDLFRGEVQPERYDAVPDKDDRVFAAVAAATGSVLVTLDQHLLARRGEGDLEILTPEEFRRHRVRRGRERRGGQGSR